VLRSRPHPFIGLIALLGLLAAALSSAPAVGRSFVDSYPVGSHLSDAVGRIEAFKAGELEPGEWMSLQRANASGRIPSRAYGRAIEQANAIGRATQDADPALAAAEWTAMGPTNIGGRVVELAVDPIRGNSSCVGTQCVPVRRVYAAAATGGVFRSSDSGLTWTRAWPDDITQAMGALAIGSDGVLYAGTGEANPGGGSIVYGGTGLYRSKDGGDTWENVGLATSGAFGRIAVDPSDPKRVFAAAAGNLFAPGGQRGLFLSEDGGDTWRPILLGKNATTGAVDIAIDPENPQNILAAMWDHARVHSHRIYGGVGSSVWRSTDGGATWTEATLPHGLPEEEIGRIGVAFAPSDPDRAYAVIANKLDGYAGGMFRSDDGGATWTRTIGPGSSSFDPLSQSSYGWWFGKAWVDPANADRVFVAGLEVMESIDGATSFRAHSVSPAGVVSGVHYAANPHADQHAMVWDPSIPNRVYLGNDGGVYRSDSGGRPGTWIGGVSQGWTQHYSVGVSQQNPNRVVSGLQDNMCQRNYVAGNQNTQQWTKYGLCGDGLQTLINPEDDNLAFGCAQYGSNCSRTVDGGGAFIPLGATSGRHGWWAPMVFDPNNADIMYKASNRLFRSTNNGDRWTAISDDLSTDPEQHDANTGYRIYGTITTIAVAKTDPNTIYVGTDEGLLWKTTDLGGEWTLLSDGDDQDDLPGTWVTRLAVDPTDANVVYATYSSFRNASDAAHVVRSADGGATWSNISGDLPAAPVNDIVFAGDDLAVGTDVGVFFSRDLGLTWLRVGSDLATVVVPDLEYHAGTNTLTAATFGHGVQRVTLPA
jgi:photosystem II stability/assembly factor-like uncharacterized protein